jgi:hypothetical protein
MLKSRFFDLILLGDHPPEIKAETMLRDSTIQGDSSACLVLRRAVLETDIEHFRGLGVITGWSTGWETGACSCLH